MALVAAALYSPLSRGAVTLRSADPEDAPLVEQRLLSDPRDAAAHGDRGAAGGAADRASRACRACYDEAYLLPREAPLRLINGTGRVGALKAVGAAAVLGAPAARAPGGDGARDRARPAARRSAYGIVPLRDDEIVAASGTMFHPSGTCRMGQPSDAGAVVDPQCRVHGSRGSASSMPR